MIKARKRFVLYAMLSVFILLAILLGSICGISFTMAGEDADRLTQRISETQGILPDAANAADGSGLFFRGRKDRGARPGDYGLLGPDSPEMQSSLRYFTAAFDQEGNSSMITFRLSVVSEEEALTWAQSLLKENPTGWTERSYRYRVYRKSGITYVTVIDQGRELLAPYRILTISVIGLVGGLVISFIVLMLIGRRLFRPLEEADRKQKRFIADAEKEFKVPLTVINANTEIWEREHGENEQTLAINRQVKKMFGLVRNLGASGIYEQEGQTALTFDLSSLASQIADASRHDFEEKNLQLEIRADRPVSMTGDSEAISSLLTELLANAAKFARTKASLEVAESNGRITVTASNDTTLPDGTPEQVFDRFTRLENAADLPGVGLGLPHVREIAQAHNGRVSARVENGIFTLRVSF